MSVKAKTAIIVVVAVVCVLAVVLGILFAVWSWPVDGKRNDDHWYSKMEYTKDYAVNIEKDPDKDFKILAISDMQFSDEVDIFGLLGNAYDEIEDVVAKTEPDMIMVMGDVVWTKFTKVAVIQFTKFMDDLKIPWAVIMGNHEAEERKSDFCKIDKNWVADQFMKSEYCLLRKGPDNIGGVGNYVININENGKIRESMILMDTHSTRNYPELGVKGAYDYIYDSQMDWYKWVVEGNKKINGGEDPESMLFIHIPLCEYNDAYEAWEASGFDPRMGFGEKNEGNCPGYVNTGMFDLLKEMGSTKYVFAAHDHSNNYSVEYEGIRLTYTMKTGDRCSYKEGLTGGTQITIGDTVGIEHIFAGK